MLMCEKTYHTADEMLQDLHLEKSISYVRELLDKNNRYKYSFYRISKTWSWQSEWGIATNEKAYMTFLQFDQKDQLVKEGFKTRKEILEYLNSVFAGIPDLLPSQKAKKFCPDYYVLSGTAIGLCRENTYADDRKKWELHFPGIQENTRYCIPGFSTRKAALDYLLQQGILNWQIPEV